MLIWFRALMSENHSSKCKTLPYIAVKNRRSYLRTYSAQNTSYHGYLCTVLSFWFCGAAPQNQFKEVGKIHKGNLILVTRHIFANAFSSSYEIPCTKSTQIAIIQLFFVMQTCITGNREKTNSQRTVLVIPNRRNLFTQSKKNRQPCEKAKCFIFFAN